MTYTKTILWRTYILLSLLAYTALNAVYAKSHENLEPIAARIAKETIIIDTHIDVPYRLNKHYEDISLATEKGDFDHPRAVTGGLDAPFMSIYIPAKHKESEASYQLANKLIDDIESIVANAPKKFALAYTTEDIKNNFKLGKISLPMGMENGSPINGKIENLQHFYKRGIRYITLTHSKSNHISDSSYDPERQWKGLSPFGKQLITEMNNIGMMVDISHVSDDAFYQAVKLSKTPVIASHSSVRRFTPGFERNMNDDMIKALAENGGVIQINFGSTFVKKAARQHSDKHKAAREQYYKKHNIDPDSQKAKQFSKDYYKKYPLPFADVEDVLDHYDHVIKLVGIDHVGIGSDYDGVGDTLPTNLKDVSSYPNLIAGLLKRGYSEADIKKILSGNLLRVWQAVEQYAEQHRNSHKAKQ